MTFFDNVSSGFQESKCSLLCITDCPLCLLLISLLLVLQGVEMFKTKNKNLVKQQFVGTNPFLLKGLLYSALPHDYNCFIDLMIAFM